MATPGFPNSRCCKVRAVRFASWTCGFFLRKVDDCNLQDISTIIPKHSIDCLFTPPQFNIAPLSSKHEALEMILHVVEQLHANQTQSIYDFVVNNLMASYGSIGQCPFNPSTVANVPKQHPSIWKKSQWETTSRDPSIKCEHANPKLPWPKSFQIITKNTLGTKRLQVKVPKRSQKHKRPWCL